MRLRALTVVGIGVSALLGAGVGFAADQGDEGSRGHHRSITWQDASGAELAMGLYVLRTRPDFFLVRVLAETPDGSRIVMTQTLDPRTGIDETTLLDDASGWWARVSKDLEITEETLPGFFQASERSLPLGKEISVRLTTEDGFAFETGVAIQEPKEMHWSFIERLAATGSVPALSDSIPPALHEAILFLDSSLSPDPLPSLSPENGLAHAVRGPIEILAGALRQAPPEGLTFPEDPSAMEMGPPVKGLALSDPATLELVAGFRSVETERLLPEEARN